MKYIPLSVAILYLIFLSLMLISQIYFYNLTPGFASNLRSIYAIDKIYFDMWLFPFCLFSPLIFMLLNRLLAKENKYFWLTLFLFFINIYLDVELSLHMRV